jgi:hypothetical protein
MPFERWCQRGSERHKRIVPESAGRQPYPLPLLSIGQFVQAREQTCRHQGGFARTRGPYHGHEALLPYAGQQCSDFWYAP